MKRIYYILSIILLLAFAASSCKKEEAAKILQNDCIKRSLGPNVVGGTIEFAYAMALPQSAGKLTTATVEASIAGDAGTWMENNSYYANSTGVDVPVLVGSASVTTSTKTTVTFTKDTCASTLRFYYIVPEAARGLKVSFTFSVTASNGQTETYSMGPYSVANMDMKLDITLSDGNLMYLSIADLTAYNAATAATIPTKIDLVYLYRVVTGVTFLHALVSPATDPQYLPGITLPTGVSNSTPFYKVWNLADQQLARLQYGIYVDDVDLQKINFADMPNFGINMKTQAGAWVQTADGKYNAYIYINAVDNTAKTMKVSIKRLTMK